MTLTRTKKIEYWLGISGGVLGIVSGLFVAFSYFTSLKDTNKELSAKYDTMATKFDGLIDKVTALSNEVNKLEDLHLKASTTIVQQGKLIATLAKKQTEPFAAMALPEAAKPVPEVKAIETIQPKPAPLPKIPVLDLNKDILIGKKYCFFDPNAVFKNGLK